MTHFNWLFLPLLLSNWKCPGGTDSYFRTGRNFQRVGGIWVQWWGGEQWQGAVAHLVVRKECKASVGDVNVKSWHKNKGIMESFGYLCIPNTSFRR